MIAYYSSELPIMTAHALISQDCLSGWVNYDHSLYDNKQELLHGCSTTLMKKHNSFIVMLSLMTTPLSHPNTRKSLVNQVNSSLLHGL